MKNNNRRWVGAASNRKKTLDDSHKLREIFRTLGQNCVVMDITRDLSPKAAPAIVIVLMILIAALPTPSFAEPVPAVGDIILVGTVARSGQRLTNDATLFEGDLLSTATGSGGVLRIGRGRIELGESTRVEIARARPLSIVLLSGSLAFNFPAGSEFEFITPPTRGPVESRRRCCFR